MQDDLPQPADLGIDMEHGPPSVSGQVMLPRVTLDLSADRRRADRLPGRHRVRQRQRAAAGRPDRGRAGRPAAPDRCTGTATPRSQTVLGRPERVAIAGHIDTVPLAGNLPSRRTGGVLHGLGSCDMKSGVAVAARLAAAADRAVPGHHLRVLRRRGSRGRAQRPAAAQPAAARSCSRPTSPCSWSPPAAVVEGGCQGTMRAEVRATGERAHSARSWMGRNAIHEAGAILDVLRRLPGPPARRGRADLPRGPERRRDQRRRGRERDPRRVRRDR